MRLPVATEPYAILPRRIEYFRIVCVRIVLGDWVHPVRQIRRIGFDEPVVMIIGQLRVDIGS